MLYDSFGGPLQLDVVLVGPPKKDRKQSIKNDRSLSFHFDFLGLSLCGFVPLSVCPLCPNFPLYLNNYFIKSIYMCPSSERPR